jgi:phosphatidylserine/phosphatidylglycerophosphate/cardiolipin synthase-like enzyme
MSRLILLVFLVVIAGCVKDSHTRLQIDEKVAAQIDRTISCAKAPEGSCAISSEFQELADHASASSTSEAPVHYVSIVNNGQDALLARIHLIRAAKKSIELQTYIWANDEVGRLVFFELLQAARRGVRVRIIVDQITVAEDPALLARLATAHVNLEISFYNPTFSRGKTTPLMLTTGVLFSFKKINQRMHNKVLIIDGKIGIAGGRNIENKYYDYSHEYNFKDRDIIIIGPAVMQMNGSFERYWDDEVVVKAVHLVDVGQEVIKLVVSDKPTLLDRPDLAFFSDVDNLAHHHTIFEDRPSLRPSLAGPVEFIADLPGKSSKNEVQIHEDSSRFLREILSEAQKSITIQTPYFVLSRTARNVLKKMRKQNPDLQLIVSSNSLAATDLDLIYAITFKHKRIYIKNLHINLFEFRPYPGDARRYIPRYDQLLASHDTPVPLNPSEHNDIVPAVRDKLRFGMHAKSIVVDSKIAIIGSHNLTPRSVNINTEVAVIIWDENVARKLERNILLDTEPQNSWVIAKRQKVPFVSYFTNIIGSISSMLPVFDIWPFHYTSSFQLKKGMEALPPDHPDFYKHYDDVGQFPDVDQPSKSIKTRLIKSFGGFITPLI